MSTGDVEAVVSRADLARYLAGLADSVRDGGASIENDSAADFIEAAGHWITAMDGHFANRRESVPEVPSWNLIAKIFSAAVVYE